jgi:hypothetical protein
MIDLDDERLRDKSFAAGVRFTCSNVVKRWDAVPAHVCGGTASVTVRPPKERRILPTQSILHCFIGCPRCVPGWGILDVRPDDPLWKPLFDQKVSFGCPTCGARLGTYWSGHDGIPFTDGYDRWKGPTPYDRRPDTA